MKRFILFALCAAAVLPLFLVTGCVREELPDNRDTEYGYIQFKLYKEASYGKSRLRSFPRQAKFPSP